MIQVAGDAVFLQHHAMTYAVFGWLVIGFFNAP
jgi:hypothetical protein